MSSIVSNPDLNYEGEIEDLLRKSFVLRRVERKKTGKFGH